MKKGTHVCFVDNKKFSLNKRSQVAIILIVIALIIVGAILAYILLKPKPAEKKCGDGKCMENENWKNCPVDCPKPEKAICGDNVCQKDLGENTKNCLKDCPAVSVCGDGKCDSKELASNSCPEDCEQIPITPGCGNEKCDAGETCSNCPVDCGSCPTPTAGGNNFGVAGGIEKFSNQMKEAGVELVREWIVWGEIEPVNNQYDWTRMDDKVNKANSAEIKILGYFAFIPNWAKVNPDCNADICTLKDMNEFKEFAKKVAERYKGKMEYIEILNEVTVSEFFEKSPANKYEDWLIAGYEGIKQGNPNANVLIGGFVDPRDVPTFVNNMLQNYNQYYDIVNFHSYSEDDREIIDSINYIKGRINAYNINKPLWITETATLTEYSTGWQNNVARGVVKRYVSALGNGIEKVFWWPFIGEPVPEEGGNSQKTIALGWGIKSSNEFHPRQAYNTYKLMTSKLKGFSSVARITDTQYKFIVNNKPVYVLWLGSIPSEITGEVKVTDYLGSIETKQANEIVLNGNPIFVEVV